MNNEPLFTEELRNLLTEMQYSSLTLQEILPVINDALSLSLTASEVTLYDSDQMGIGTTSGFDAIAIHVQQKEENLDQVYYIVRGTEDAPDVYYDAAGIAANATKSQLFDAERFFNKVDTSIRQAGGTPENFGDGHSLGGHIITNLALKVNTNEDVYPGTSFAHVRGLNDAPTNVYGLLDFDPGFLNWVKVKHGVKEPKTLSPNVLFSYAKTYYKEPVSIIEHYRVKGEPLYAQDFHGSFYIGSQIHYLGDMDTKEFTNVGAYPFAHLSWIPLIKLEEMRYNAGVNWLLQGMKEFDSDIGFEKAMEMQESPLGRFLLGARLSKDAVLYGGPLITHPGFHYNLSQGAGLRDQLAYHGIAHLSSLYRTAPATTFYNILDPLSGLPIMIKQEELHHFLTRCQEIVQEKEQILQALTLYETSHLQEAYQHTQQVLWGEMEKWEQQPEKFVSTHQKGHHFGILGGLDGVQKPTSLTFETYFSPLEAAIVGPIEEIRRAIHQEKEHLQQFIEDILATMDVLLEKDFFLAGQIKTSAIEQGGVRTR